MNGINHSLVHFRVDFPSADTAVVHLVGELDMAYVWALGDLLGSVALTSCTAVDIRDGHSEVWATDVAVA